MVMLLKTSHASVKMHTDFELRGNSSTRLRGLVVEPHANGAEK